MPGDAPEELLIVSSDPPSSGLSRLSESGLRRQMQICLKAEERKMQMQRLRTSKAPSPGHGPRACRARVTTFASHARTDAHENGRRAVLGGVASLLVIPCRQAWAGFGWDGSSAALGSCAIGEEGADCRRQQILKDKLGGSGYPDSSGQEGRPQAVTGGIPVSEMKDAYTRETAALGDVVDKYFSLEDLDPQRPDLVKTIKNDGAAWASKYARGGSARKLSARKFYIVVDALQGHITSNGFAPLPSNKMQTLQKNVAETRDLLSKGS